MDRGLIRSSPVQQNRHPHRVSERMGTRSQAHVESGMGVLGLLFLFFTLPERGCIPGSHRLQVVRGIRRRCREGRVHGAEQRHRHTVGDWSGRECRGKRRCDRSCLGRLSRAMCPVDGFIAVARRNRPVKRGVYTSTVYVLLVSID